MKSLGSTAGVVFFIVICALVAGCEKSTTSKPADEKATPTSASPAHPPRAADAKKPTPPPATDAASPAPTQPAQPPSNPPAPPPPTAPVDRSGMMPGKPLELTGLTLTVPDGWVREEVPPGPMAAVAAFKLPKVEGDQADAAVRITHFPNMKGMDDQNIDRWLGQVTQANGAPYTRTGANIDTKTIGNVKMTVIDLSGSVKATMSADPKPNSRMIATILDHPQGPHFVVVTGDAATMARWEGSISAFLRSAKAN